MIYFLVFIPKYHWAHIKWIPWICWFSMLKLMILARSLADSITRSRLIRSFIQFNLRNNSNILYIYIYYGSRLNNPSANRWSSSNNWFVHCLINERCNLFNRHFSWNWSSSSWNCLIFHFPCLYLLFILLFTYSLWRNLSNFHRNRSRISIFIREHLRDPSLRHFLSKTIFLEETKNKLIVFSKDKSRDSG